MIMVQFPSSFKVLTTTWNYCLQISDGLPVGSGGTLAQLPSDTHQFFLTQVQLELFCQHVAVICIFVCDFYFYRLILK